MHEDCVRTLDHESRLVLEAIDGHRLLGRVVRGDAERDEYVRFLATTYHYVRWSGELLAKTAGGLGRSGRCTALLEMIARKAEEEAPHDRSALEDLTALGVDAELVKAEVPPHAVLGYVHSSRAWAESGSPAFLGAAFLLESVSMQRARVAADNLRRARRIPNIERALTFLELHGEADVEHVAELVEKLRSVEPREDRREIAGAAALLREMFPLFFAQGGT